MKILHLSTSSGGGAGLAALRLIAAQRAAGIDSELLTQSGGRLLSKTGSRRIPSDSRLQQKLTTLANRMVTRDNQFFYSPYSASVIAPSQIISREPDVIHVHNWYNLVSWETLETIAVGETVVVATAHDERLLTGGCHLTQGCDGYLANCPTCPQARLDGIAASPALRLRDALSKSGSKFVGPSLWLAERLRSRLQVPRSDIHHIPNCLDPEIFRPPVDPRRGVPVLGVMTGKADSLVDSSLAVLSRMINQGFAPEPIIHFAGSGAHLHWPGRSVNFGVLRTESQRAEFWRSCDVAFAATFGDNFPNVNLEAIFSGAVVVTCRVGGAAEAIESTGRGMAATGHPQELAETIAVSLSNVNESRKSAWDAWSRASQLYGGTAIASRYIELYETANSGP